MPKTSITFTAQLDRFNSNLWHFHFIVPVKIAKKFIEGNDRRVVCTINETITFQAALMHLGEGEFFINVNQKIRSKLKLNDGDEIKISLEKDESEYGLPMPEELAELMKLDDEGREVFHSLTAGKQRTMLHFIGLPKNMDIRIRRAICVLEHLKQNNGKIIYRELMDAVKNSK
jgi:bifunctional DNA-binding transcriptional regulator/antitoxin component of YhaV-PrlF toxin-antitoxin module